MAVFNMNGMGLPGVGQSVLLPERLRDDTGNSESDGQLTTISRAKCLVGVYAGGSSTTSQHTGCMRLQMTKKQLSPRRVTSLALCETWTEAVWTTGDSSTCRITPGE